MYTKDKNQRITLRLSDTQFLFVKSNADVLGVSPSDFLRMVINATMATSKTMSDNLPKYTEALAEDIKINYDEVTRRENEPSDKHDIV